MTHVLAAVTATQEIRVGEHPKWHFLGLTVNADTFYTTLIAGAVTVLLSIWVARRATSGVPNKVQVIYETVINQTRVYVEEALGKQAPPWLVPLGFVLFFFILFANWLSWFPSGHDIGKGREYLAPPTADTNLTFALTAVVMGGYIYYGIKRKGIRYVTSWFTAKPAIRRPILVIEQISNPLSLSLRLFGNIFAGTIMLAIIALLPTPLVWAQAGFNVAWKMFDDGFIAVIQAFIFAFLSILYFGFAAAEEH